GAATGGVTPPGAITAGLGERAPAGAGAASGALRGAAGAAWAAWAAWTGGGAAPACPSEPLQAPAPGTHTRVSAASGRSSAVAKRDVRAVTGAEHGDPRPFAQ